jgi:hypothetical protein
MVLAGAWAASTAQAQAPTLLGPVDGAETTTTPSLTWAGPAGVPVTSYRVQVSDNAGFDACLIDKSDCTSNWYTVPPEVLALGTRYYWRVKAIVVGGETAWSATWSFWATKLQSPALKNPPDGSDVTSIAPWLQWTIVPYAKWYLVKVALDEELSNVVYSATVTNMTVHEVPPGKLGMTTWYYWSVCAMDPFGHSSDWAEPWSFHTPGEMPPTIARFDATLGYRYAYEGGAEVGFFVSLRDVPAKDCTSVWNTFRVRVDDPSGLADVKDVRFTLGDQIAFGTPNDEGWFSATFDMSQLREPWLEGDLWRYPVLTIQARDRDDEESDEYQVTIKTVPPPSWLGKSYVFRPAGQQSVSWDPATETYTFRGNVPGDPRLYADAGELLGIGQISLPFLGELPTYFDSYVRVVETFTTDGQWTYSATGVVDARLLGYSLLDEQFPADVDYYDDPNHFRALTAYSFPSENLLQLSGQLPTFRTTYTFYPDWVELTVSFSADFGYYASLGLAMELGEALALDTVKLMPSAGVWAELQAQVDVFWGVASVKVGLRPCIEFGMSIVMDDFVWDPPCFFDLSAEDSYLGFRVQARATGKLLWGWAGTYSTGWVQIGCYKWSKGAPPPQAGQTPDYDYSLTEAPSLAWNLDQDVGMLLWVADRDESVEGADPDLAYALLGPMGEILPGGEGYVAENDRFETDPKVAWRAPDPGTGGARAIAVWTQNEIPKADQAAHDHVEDVLAQQEIYAALWGEDGSPGWSEPVRLTQNQVPDGRPALATDPDADRAVVAWVRDQDSQVSTPGSLDICLRSYEAGEWTPEIVMWAPEVADLEPAVASRGGRSALVWVSDADADLTTNPDRLLWYATQDGGAGWSAPQAIAGSAGALYPSVDLDPSGQPVIAFCQRLDFEDGSAGEGTRDFLRYAFLKDGQWVVGRPGDRDTRAQWPVVRVSESGAATIVFRILEADGLARVAGDAARVEVDLHQGGAPEAERSSPPTCLTDDDCLDWQITFDLAGSDAAHIITVTDLLREDMPTGAAQVAPDIWFFTMSPVPRRPVITSPGALNVFTDEKQPHITIAGTAPPEAVVVVLYGGKAADVLLPVDGYWEVETGVPPGRTEYRVASRNAAGESAMSEPVTVIWNVFGDLPDDHWALMEIMTAYAASVVVGFEDHTYRPSVVVTRDQMAVYISRAMAGGDAFVRAAPATATFPDVPTDQWASKYVEYAVGEGVVSGYADGRYRPGVQLDRGQMAVFIARALVAPSGDAGVPDPPVKPTFPDVPSSFWAYDQVEYLAREGITRGYLDGLYRPGRYCTRDQMAVYVRRAFELDP